MHGLDELRIAVRGTFAEYIFEFFDVGHGKEGKEEPGRQWDHERNRVSIPMSCPGSDGNVITLFPIPRTHASIYLNRRNAEQLRIAAATLVYAIKEGTELWRTDRRMECHALYAKAGARAVARLPPGQVQDDFRVTLAAAR